MVFWFYLGKTKKTILLQTIYGLGCPLASRVRFLHLSQPSETGHFPITSLHQFAYFWPCASRVRFVNLSHPSETNHFLITCLHQFADSSIMGISCPPPPPIH